MMEVICVDIADLKGWGASDDTGQTGLGGRSWKPKPPPWASWLWLQLSSADEVGRESTSWPALEVRVTVSGALCLLHGHAHLS